MSILKRLLGIQSKKEEDKLRAKSKHESKFMPQKSLPVDEMFMDNFKKNGGKFLYCDDENDLQNNFNQILLENEWEKEDVFVKAPELLKRFKINTSKKDAAHANYFLTTTEYLIANTGALLVDSDQIGEKRLADLPYNFIVIATTSQLLETIGEGLQLIKLHKNKLPSNITTLKTFEGKVESDFMSYGSPSKNLYLLLLEDL
jgi:L-lactate utilization protein LutC